MRPAAEAEKLGIPSVVVTVPGFVTIANLSAKAAGVAGLRLAEYPGTVSIGSTLNWGFSPSPYTRSDKTGAQAALELLCIEATRKPCLGLFAERGPKSFINDITFLVAPPVAQSLAEAGYTKHKIRDYLYKNAKLPLRVLKWELRYGLAEVHTVEEKVALGLFPKEFLAGPDELVPIIPSPDLVNLVVCGHPGRNRVKTLDSGYTLLTTKEIKLPANWNQLLKE